MATRKIPYYRMESSLIPFRPIRWQAYAGSRGCVPLATQTGVSLERPAPGVTPPPPQPTPPKVKLSRQAIKAQKEEERLQKHAEAEAAKTERNSKPPMQADELVLEECKDPPVFDLQDIPDAMEKMGWPVSAKLARTWFNAQKHIYDNDPNSVQPYESTSVTLDWVLRFGKVRDIYKDLIERGIYNRNGLGKLERILSHHLSTMFIHTKALDLDTGDFLKDLRQFHIDWQFQRASVFNQDTMQSNFSLTDLTGSLARFNLYAAIAKATVRGDKYFLYDDFKKTKTFCINPKVEVTHVFVYIKDSYSFNDDPDGVKSQYLGHWNKTGIIITPKSVLSQAVDGSHKIFGQKSINVRTHLGNYSEDRSKLHSLYFTDEGLEFLVDTRKGLFQKNREQDIYFPIYNKNFNAWREKHARGGDFMIYSRPKLVKLDKPIRLQLQPICRPPEPM